MSWNRFKGRGLLASWQRGWFRRSLFSGWEAGWGIPSFSGWEVRVGRSFVFGLEAGVGRSFVFWLGSWLGTSLRFPAGELTDSEHSFPFLLNTWPLASPLPTFTAMMHIAAGYLRANPAPRPLMPTTNSSLRTRLPKNHKTTIPVSVSTCLLPSPPVSYPFLLPVSALLRPKRASSPFL